MSHPVHSREHARDRLFLSKIDIPPEVRQALNWFENNLHQDFEPVRDDLVDALRDGRLDPGETIAIRNDIRELAGEYRTDVLTTFENGTEKGANAGVELAERRYPIEVSFDLVPESVLREFDTWSAEAVDNSMKTLTEDVTHLVRGAHEEGLSIDAIAENVDEMMGNRYVQNGSWKSRQIARTATIPSSNAGTHATYQDANSVVGEEWIDTADLRTRTTHSAAGGQIVAPGTSFEVGSATARYPGDPSLPLKELINCRCTSAPVFADQLTAGELDTIQSGGRVWA